MLFRNEKGIRKSKLRVHTFGIIFKFVEKKPRQPSSRWRFKNIINNGTNKKETTITAMLMKEKNNSETNKNI